MCYCTERYLREIWPAATKALKEVGIGCELNLVSNEQNSLVILDRA